MFTPGYAAVDASCLRSRAFILELITFIYYNKGPMAQGRGLLKMGEIGPQLHLLVSQTFHVFSSGFLTLGCAVL